ncbi:MULTISPECIES: AAA family ATPase [Paraliobacillus]|uniref:AAA family ATPase n=1 Tax=Paraliobacillus TaxID=200903 RepID=UPI0013A70544|nr:MULTISPECIES: AAA family ATPase [Paraliobacillus]
MLTELEFHEIEPMWRVGEFQFLRGIPDSSDKSLLLRKQINCSTSSQTELEREFYILKKVSLPNMLVPINVCEQGILFEDTDGQPLRTALKNKTLTILDKLEIALHLVETIHHYHEQGKINLTITPDQLILDSTNQIKIIPLPYAIEPFKNKYQSPEALLKQEQTYDHRSDLYKLGMLLYVLFTNGSHPFPGNKNVNWKHSHIAVEPVSLTRMNRTIPKMINDIMMTLLAKNPVNRYQSGSHLLKDLAICWNALKEHGTIEPFRLSLKRIDGHFKLPNHFYGREDELKVLYDLFQKSAFGSTELVLLNGASGIGKTRLVNDQFRHMIQNRAYFISGKFDQMQNNVPYQSLVEAFREIVSEILTQTNQQVADWKDKILTAVGTNGYVITSVIPELTAIIGEQERMELLSEKETEHRFISVFRQFVQVFTSIDYPLVLFLDDIHWADQASIRLIHSLLTDPNCHRFIVIGSFRGSVEEQATFIEASFKDMDQYGVRTTSLQLPDLSITDTEQFVADAFDSELVDTRGLARLVFQKTAGNPFYTEQLLQLIYRNKWITFEYASQKWGWNEIAIHTIKDQEHILSHMISKISQLPVNVKDTLRITACFGNSFYKKDLALFSMLSSEEIGEALEIAEQEGLILPPDLENGNKRYHFFHDRIQQIAYSLNTETDKQRIHLGLGRFLISIDPKEELIYKTVDHYNKGNTLIKEITEKDKLIQLNYRAGYKAKESTAYDTALHYFQSAADMMEASKWQTDFTFSFQLYLELSGAAYKCGDYRLADNIYTDLLQKARSSSERSLVYCKIIIQYVNQGKYEEAINAGLYCLDEMNINIPTNPTDQLQKQAIRSTKAVLPKDLTKLKDIPDTEDKEIDAIMAVLFQLFIPSFFSNKGVFTLIICNFVQLILQHGKTNVSPAVFAGYGILLCTELEEFDSSYQIGKIAVDLADDTNLASVQCKTYMMFGGIICQWDKNGIQGEGTAYLKKAITLGMRVGDYIYTSMAIGAHINRIYVHETLATIGRVNQGYVETLEQIRENFVLKNAQVYVQFTKCLQSMTAQPLSMNDASFNEEMFLAEIEQQDTKNITLFQFYTYKTQICYLNGAYQEAVAYAVKAEAYIAYANHLPHLGEHHFYKALAMLECWKDEIGEKQMKWTRMLRSDLEQLAKWREHNQENYAHKEWLIRAEYARVLDYPDKAEILYDQAITAVEKSGFGRNIAITNELAGKFYHIRGKTRMAKLSLEVAVEEYNNWGLKAKAKAIRQTYPAYFPIEKDNVVMSEAYRNEPLQIQDELDAYPVNSLATIMKASEAMAEEMDFALSLKKLMLSIKRESLAEKAILLITKGDEITVTAIVKGSADFILVNETLEQSVEIPQQIIRYVARTKNQVRTDDQAYQKAYQSDAYLKQQLPKSVLCLPLSLQGEFKGILYLENRWIAHLFAEEQAKIVKYLGTQAMFVNRLLETFQISEKPKVENETEDDNPDMMLFEELTERELEIINLMAAGLSNQEIARTLGLKIGTVKVHNHNIFSKLDVTRRTKAVFKANELKLIKQG